METGIGPSEKRSTAGRLQRDHSLVGRAPTVETERTRKGWRIFAAIPFATVTAALGLFVWVVSVIFAVGDLPYRTPRSMPFESLLATVAASALASFTVLALLWGFGNRTPRQLARPGRLLTMAFAVVLGLGNVWLANL